MFPGHFGVLLAMSHDTKKKVMPAKPLNVDEIEAKIRRAKKKQPQSAKAREQLRLARAGFDQLPNHQRTQDLDNMIRSVEHSHG